MAGYSLLAPVFGTTPQGMDGDVKRRELTSIYRHDEDATR
jgi:hypothetical protein